MCVHGVPQHRTRWTCATTTVGVRGFGTPRVCGLFRPSLLSSPRGERVVYIAAVATRLEAPGVVSPAHARHFRRGTRDGVHETLVRHRLAAHQLQHVLIAFDTDAAKRKGGEV